MAVQPTIADVRKTREDQVERLEKLKRQKSLATPAEQESIQKDIDIVAQDICNLDTVIQGLIEPKTAKH
jgi:hypothetical protein